MESIKLKLYPRGFLGAPMSAKIERQPTAVESRIRRLQRTFILNEPTGNTIQANERIDSLYAEWIKDPINLDAMAFRDKVLHAAVGAFGTREFSTWYLGQFNSPALGELHNRFLEDTLAFIDGKRRQYPLMTWESLLSHSDTGIIRTEMSEHVAEFFGYESNGYQRRARNRDLLDVIQSWVSQPNGFEDMLVTLHVLFGY